MTISNIEGYQFEQGYSLTTTKFNNVPAVYVIYTSQLWLDVGETDQLGTRMASHERKPDWISSTGLFPIFVAVHREGSMDTRLAIESDLRKRLCPTCGDR
jgi:hypothetical protein